jgi:hypothetical protein
MMMMYSLFTPEMAALSFSSLKGGKNSFLLNAKAFF